MPAAEVADRFGYSTASVHQMATRAAHREDEAVHRPVAGPERAPQGHRRTEAEGARAAAQGHSVTETAYVLTGRQRLRRKPSDVDGEPSLGAEGFDRAQESLRPAAVDSGVRLRQRQKTVQVEPAPHGGMP